jgi:hypothetical protein
MQNRRVKTLEMAMAGLLLMSTWALAAEESAGAVAAQLSSVDLQKGTVTLQVDNTRQLAAVLLENDAVNLVITNPKHVRERERQEWVQDWREEREERVLQMQRSPIP